jgi:C4-dicarboxylate-specific signal transduction histidine kinase
VSLLVSRAGRVRARREVQESEAARRLAEEAAGRQREELAHALRVSTLGELTASFAHEINQPLAAIMTNAQGARRIRDPQHVLSVELDEVLLDIAADAKRASETIRRLQTLYRKQHFDRTPVHVNPLIEDSVALLRSNLAGRCTVVRLALGQGLPPVPADPIQLQQVVLNLVLNACDAMATNEEDAREIRIETRHEAGRLAITVSDQGGAVPDTELERIFEHFVSTKPNGLGMGLAISRSIVQAHGGRIWASRNPDRGLTLHVELPESGPPARRAAWSAPAHPAHH